MDNSKLGQNEQQHGLLLLMRKFPHFHIQRHQVNFKKITIILSHHTRRKEITTIGHVLELETKPREKKCSFSKQFTVTGKRADTLNKTDVSILEELRKPYVFIGIGTIILLIVIVPIFLLRKETENLLINKNEKD